MASVSVYLQQKLNEERIKITQNPALQSLQQIAEPLGSTPAVPVAPMPKAKEDAKPVGAPAVSFWNYAQQKADFDEKIRQDQKTLQSLQQLATPLANPIKEPEIPGGLGGEDIG